MEFRNYFQAYDDYFWQWVKDDDQYVITTSQGASVAYVAYVFELLEGLSLSAAPPFGSLVLAIMATDENPSRFVTYLETKLKEKEKQNSFPNRNVYQSGAALKFLKNLASLPSEYKKGEKRKLLLFSIFKNAHNSINSRKTKRFVEIYNVNPDLIDVCAIKQAFNASSFARDIKTIALLSDEFPTTKSLLDAILEFPVEEYSDQVQNDFQELQSADRPHDFVDRLIHENETFYVGSLIKRLWSGLNINMRHRSPSEQPLGGVSDVTNKGDVSRLLLSEFANDDDVFVHRIANNEALYILREVPPESNQLDRNILLDSSIKCWGNVRTINLAIALAIAKHPKTEYYSKIFGVTHDIKEVHFDNVHEIISGLNILAPTLDCLNGIEHYVEHHYKSNQELFFVTTQEHFQQLELQNTLKTHQDKIGYVIYTNEIGEIKIYKQLKSGKKHVQDLNLNLSELWYKKLQPVKISTRNSSSDIPILYPSQKNYLILFFEEEFYKISNRILYRFHNNNLEKGFELIAHLPHYEYQFIQNALLYKNEYQELVLVCYSCEFNDLIFNNLNTNLIRQIPVEMTGSIALDLINDSPYLIVDRRDFYHLSEREVKQVNGVQILENYALSSFLHGYRVTRFKVNVLNNVRESIKITQSGYLTFDAYMLYDNTFHKWDNLHSDANDFELVADLVLKTVGDKHSDAINSIKQALGFELAEAKTIIEEGIGNYPYNKTIQTNKKYSNLLNYKSAIENTGCVCYIVPKYWVSKDGSQIHLNDGIFKLISSDESIPIIYVPFVTGMPTALSTNEEFSGNTYFLPEDSTLSVIEVKAFYEKYMQPFIQTIIKHGV